jgi:hypothetical protein
MRSVLTRLPGTGALTASNVSSFEILARVGRSTVYQTSKLLANEMSEGVIGGAKPVS